MNAAWFLFYGRQLGMTRVEALSCPVGELLDMMACYAIQNGAKPRVMASIDDLAKLR